MGLGPSSDKDKQNTAATATPSSTPVETTVNQSPSKNGIPIHHARKRTADSPIMILSPPQERVFVKSPPRNAKVDLEVPTVFTWNHGGKDVYLIGTFTEWKEKISMKSSHNDFTIIQNLPPGVYQYRYIVDGKWQTDPSQPTIVDPQGIVNNFIEVKEQKKEDTIFAKKMTPGTPPGSYGQLSSDDSTAKNSPPSLPPHLLRALLNTAPPTEDPSLLPLPHHVMLNHVYSLPRRNEKMMIVGITQRYKQKFVTTVLYKALDPSVPTAGSTGELTALTNHLKLSDDDLLEEPFSP